ncbi:unnamed protein product [Didymodactylos carnosus]|uniref:Uncharacterized protein n=1 Tax=Didymodactylos carnosus TaxID=1234261 RepID=A0A814A7Y9_9BILA|nr:unnamed protein product [Didymodactylos carnosus]CAF0911002.1 unnamed protein product [Didymodactylos carnosus]CAF3541619.1 unnamed protein product [Didymodactylos carnosus]CAF3692112.1 unnamed protein product [Didymodactylos carnosus]
MRRHCTTCEEAKQCEKLRIKEFYELSPLHRTEEIVEMENNENENILAMNQFNFLDMKPLKTVQLETKHYVISASNECVIIFEQNDAINGKFVFYDNNGNKINELRWNMSENGYVRDVCWCSSKNIFLILTHNSLFTLSSSTLEWNRVKNINKEQQQQDLKSLTIHGNNIFIMHRFGEHIEKLSLSSYEIIQYWTNKSLFRQTTVDATNCYDYAGWIRSNDVYIAMTIYDKNEQWHLFLFDEYLIPTRRGFVLNDLSSRGNCLITHLWDNQWLLMNNSKTLRLIDSTIGKMKKNQRNSYNGLSINACVLNKEYIVLRSFEPNKIEFYRL